MPSDTRERLVEAAWTCIRSAGPAAATSRAITAAARANLGAITYYFGSKDALLAEAVGGAIEELVGPALAVLRDDALDPASRLLQAVSLLQQAHAQSAEDAPVYVEALTQCHRQPELQARIGAVFGEIRSMLSTLMSDLQLRGVLPEWVQPEAMAGLLLAVAQGVVLQTATDADGPHAPAMADQFARLLLASRAAPA